MGRTHCAQDPPAARKYTGTGDTRQQAGRSLTGRVVAIEPVDRQAGHLFANAQDRPQTINSPISTSSSWLARSKEHRQPMAHR
jgi:hypothetical protein